MSGAKTRWHDDNVFMARLDDAADDWKHDP
jgi:hypothetical protein